MVSDKWKYSADELKEYKKRSMAKEVWRNYKKSPSAMLGLVILVVIIILAIVAQVVFDYDEDIVQQNIMNRLQNLLLNIYLEQTSTDGIYLPVSFMVPSTPCLLVLYRLQFHVL